MMRRRQRGGDPLFDEYDPLDNNSAFIGTSWYLTHLDEMTHPNVFRLANVAPYTTQALTDDDFHQSIDNLRERDESFKRQIEFWGRRAERFTA